jgi:1,4-dihydroxy-2-naphthoyl-CoA hydrolase
MIELQVISRSDDDVRARVDVVDAIKQPLGLVHGGVFAMVADALATGPDERAISSQTSFLRPITAGAVHAHARRRHHGRTTAVWEVDITDDQDRLCALVRVTVARGSATAAGTRS